jgi:hypothetical protein
MSRTAAPRIGVVIALTVAMAVGAAGSALASEAATGQFVCRAGPTIGSGDGQVWSTIQSFASGYATGNCYDNWHLHRTRKEVNAYTWDGGYFYGDYQGCGWIRSDRDVLLQYIAYTPCANPNLSDAAIAYVIDCHHGTPNCAGTGVTSIGTCNEYANVRPWTASPAPTSGPLRSRGPGYRFNWRYVVDGRNYVMVQDGAVGAGSGNWVFVNRSCLPSTLPANPGDPAGKYYP